MCVCVCVCVCVCEWVREWEREREQNEGGKRGTQQIMLPSQLGTDKRPLTFSVCRFFHFLSTPAFLFLEKINTHYKKHSFFHIWPNLEKHIVVCVVRLSDFNQLYATLLFQNNFKPKSKQRYHKKFCRHHVIPNLEYSVEHKIRGLAECSSCSFLYNES